MEITITLGASKTIVAHYEDGHTLKTDQPVAGGGTGESLSPYQAFLGAIGTCAGVYVEDFCAHRNIPVENITITQTVDFTTDGHGRSTLAKVGLRINLPPEFPEKYRNAVAKAAELCSVKKAIMNPPEFEVTAVQ